MVAAEVAILGHTHRSTTSQTQQLAAVQQIVYPGYAPMTKHMALGTTSPATTTCMRYVMEGRTDGRVGQGKRADTTVNHRITRNQTSQQACALEPPTVRGCLAYSHLTNSQLTN